MPKITPYYVVSKSGELDSDLILNEETVDVTDSPTFEKFEKVYMLGEKHSGLKTQGPPQNFEDLRRQHVNDERLFSDATFQLKMKEECRWKRPFEITERPQFIVDGATRQDINQGNLGDCWFLAAVANLTSNQHLFEMVVPPDQSFTRNYAGIFHFKFWQYGRWIDVVVDDKLPTRDNQLLYLHSSQANEFWPALLEKAYAKLYGSYKNIEAGSICEGLEDLCGGLSEFYRILDPQHQDRNMYSIMKMSYDRASLMGCSIEHQLGQMVNQEDGLVTSHAYSITDMQIITTSGPPVKLLRIRNPWGNKVEWNGKWSDNSSAWDQVPEETRRKLPVKRYDGEFWMEFEDFQNRFTYVDICHLNPNSFSNENKKWNVATFEGDWIPHVSAGGGLDKDTFCYNPQYHLNIRGSSADHQYSVIVALMQRSRRALGKPELPLELHIYRLTEHTEALLDKEFFKVHEPVIPPARVDNTRQLTIRMYLGVGRYCIVPCVPQKGASGSYLLRIYSEVNPNARENDVEVKYLEDLAITRTVSSRENNWSNLFAWVAKNEGDVDQHGLRKALNKKFGRRMLLCFLKPKKVFSEGTCRNLVALWDSNFSGRIEEEEFSAMVMEIDQLKAVFKKFDRDSSGRLDGFELRNLLLAYGYKVGKKLLAAMMLRYGLRDGTMTFENFVICVFKLKSMIDEANKRKITGTNEITFKQEDFLQTTLYS